MERNDVTVTLYMSELLYDVQNKTYLTGRSRENGTNHEEVANMQANDDDENLTQLQRSIQSAFATLKTKLSEYLSSTQSAGDNELIPESKDTLSVTLKMPTNYNHATVDGITSALHQYIVNMAIGDWFTITNKADASDYVALATANLELVRESLNKRIRPTRRTAGSTDTRFVNREEPVATPVIAPNGNNKVAMYCTTPDATIHYTRDGSKPSATSTAYPAAGITLVSGDTDVVFKAIAVKTGMKDSAIATNTFSYEE